MLDVNNLRPVDRDSICLNCHLEGEVAIERAGKHWEQFKPGESIFDYVSYFAAESAKTKDERATSQWEALLTSGCKRRAGDRMTCTSCHDPHGSTATMSAEQRVAYYRGRCLQCHDAEAAKAIEAGLAAPAVGFAATHHVENPDCTACHMPRVRAEDIAHEQVTDHSIPRIPQRAGRSEAAGLGTLVAIGTEPGASEASGERDLGLAYAERGLRGNQAAGERALELLQAAEANVGATTDVPLHENLGVLDQVSGNLASAEKEYRVALGIDAYDAVAAGDLALIRVREKDSAGAVRLLQRAFDEDPALLTAGRNLVLLECAMGEREAAQATLARIFAFSPDDEASHQLDQAIRSGREVCATRAGAPRD